MSKNTRNLIIGFLVVILGGVLIWKAYDFGSNDLLGIIENKKAETKTTEQQSSEPPVESSTESQSMSALKSEEEILNAMHSMANTLIVPVDGQIWGKEKITKDKITGLISAINNCTSSHKEELIAILNKWNGGDFSTAVEDHNKVWKLLGGTIGKAASVNEDAVKETIASMNPS